jgi:hypothetical protein
MKKIALCSLVAAALLAGCGDDDDEGSNPNLATGPYQLTFQGDGSFPGAHAGQALEAAVIRISDGAVLDVQTTTVAASGDPSFSVTFAPTLDYLAAYRVHYWIDSNFGGGTAGVCEAPNVDHQWSVDIPMAQITFKDVHRPGASTTNVCTTFP